jgi:hypothetical protein
MSGPYWHENLNHVTRRHFRRADTACITIIIKLFAEFRSRILHKSTTAPPAGTGPRLGSSIRTRNTSRISWPSISGWQLILGARQTAAVLVPDVPQFPRHRDIRVLVIHAPAYRSRVFVRIPL